MAVPVEGASSRARPDQGVARRRGRSEDGGEARRPNARLLVNRPTSGPSGLARALLHDAGSMGFRKEPPFRKDTPTRGRRLAVLRALRDLRSARASPARRCRHVVVREDVDPCGPERANERLLERGLVEDRIIVVARFVGPTKAHHVGCDDTKPRRERGPRAMPIPRGAGKPVEREQHRPVALDAVKDSVSSVGERLPFASPSLKGQLLSHDVPDGRGLDDGRPSRAPHRRRRRRPRRAWPIRATPTSPVMPPAPSPTAGTPKPPAVRPLLLSEGMTPRPPLTSAARARPFFLLAVLACGGGTTTKEVAGDGGSPLGPPSACPPTHPAHPRVARRPRRARRRPFRRRWTRGLAAFCKADTDCVGFAHYCHAGQCTVDQCLQDSECTSGQACACSDEEVGNGERSNVCAATQCHTDAYCGSGEACSPTAVDLCGQGPFFACRSSADTCRVDADCCPSAPACRYQSSSGHWACVAACTVAG